MRSGGARGQASVEIVAVVPLLAIVLVVVWLGASAALAWVEVQGAAVAAARAHQVGAPAEDAARASLRGREGRVEVRGRRVSVEADVRVVPGGAPWTLRAERTLD